MRLYELAKELKTSDRDLLRQAEDLGVEARTLLSSLDDEDEAKLRAGYKRPLEADLAVADRKAEAALALKRAEAAAICLRLMT